MRKNTRVGLLALVIAVVLGAVTAYIYAKLGSIEESVIFVLAAGSMILCCGLSFISAICAVVMFLTSERYERD